MTFATRFKPNGLSLEEGDIETKIETDNENGDPTTDVDTDVEVTGIETDDDSTLNQLFSDLENSVDKLDDTQNDLDGLDAIADNLEKHEDGASPDVVDMANVAVESYIRRLTGKKPTKKILLSLESYPVNNKAVRIKSTRIAIENLRDIVEAGWEAIKKIFKTISDLVVKLVTYAMDKSRQLRSKISEIREKLKQVESGQISEQELDVPASIARKLSLAGTFGKEQFFKGLENLRRFLYKTFVWLAESVKTVESVDVSKTVAEAANGEQEADITANTVPLAKATKNFGKEVEDNEDGTVTVTNLEPLPGDATAYVTGPDTTVVEGQVYKMVSSQQIEITNVSFEDRRYGNDVPLSQRDRDVSDVKIKSFTAKEIETACDKMEENLTLLDRIKDLLKRPKDKFLKDSEKVKRTVDNPDEGRQGYIRTAWNKVKSFTSGVLRGFGIIAKNILYFTADIMYAAIHLLILTLGIIISPVTGGDVIDVSDQAARVAGRLRGAVHTATHPLSK